MSASRPEVSGPRPFPAYRKYRDCGVEWLCEIPAHWDVKKLAWITRCLDGRRVPLNAEQRGEMQGEYPYWGANAIVDHVDSWLFDEDLVLLGEDGAPFFDRNRPVAFHVRGKIWVNNHAHVLRSASRLDPGFLAQVLNCVDYRAFIDGSTRDKLTQGDMNSIPIQYPPLEEQRAIAAFLDRETAKIDALVAKKERLIELLQEKRTALITRAVTMGLDPNVPMKDSGVEWLGEIPAHWNAAKMWRISNATSGGTPAKEERGYWDGDIPWVSPKDMKRRFMDSSEDTLTERALAETGIKLIAPPVVLIVVRGMILAHTFPVAITTVPVTVNQDMKALRFEHAVDPVFIAWLFEGVGKGLLAAVVEEAAHGTRAIRMDQWRSVAAPVPPITEQHAIVTFLDRETARIDALLANIRAAIDRLKELRTALISAAVTGKIDVRGLA